MAPKSKPKIGGKRVHRVAVNLEADLYDRFVAACGIQKHREGQLAWILIEWALPYYEKARSVEALRGPRQPLGSSKVSAETQEQLFTALRIVLDRGARVDVEAIARILTLRAGQLAADKPRGARHENAGSV